MELTLIPKKGQITDGKKAITVGKEHVLWKVIDTGNYRIERFDSELVEEGAPYKVRKKFEELEGQITDGAVFNALGRKLISELSILHPSPVLMIGDTGWGKSVLARFIATKLGYSYAQINAHPGMDMSMLVGMWRPCQLESRGVLSRKSGGIGIQWQDGVLTTSVRTGGVFLFEELTRAPQDAVSRLYGLLDTTDRSWSIPEAGQVVPVHKEFWFLATANPQVTGYYTQRLDRALHSRFHAVYEINQPIADERAVAVRLVGKTLADKALKFLSDARSQRKVNICTRDLVMLLSALKQGLPPVRAVEICIVPKYEPKFASGLKDLARLHLESH